MVLCNPGRQALTFIERTRVGLLFFTAKSQFVLLPTR
jgi:hypothetical protein